MDGKTVEEDLHPGLHKLLAVSDGYILQDMNGIRAHIVSRLDGKGYDVTKRECHPALVSAAFSRHRALLSGSL